MVAYIFGEKRIIIGGGIAGLLTAWVKDGVIITKTTGQFDSKVMPLGPRYLHYSERMEKLLKDFKLSTETKMIKVGYYDDTQLMEKPSQVFLMNYSYKSGRQGQVTSAMMNAGKNEMKVFKTTETQLGSKLLERLKERIFYVNQIEKIRCKSKEIDVVITDTEIEGHSLKKKEKTITIKADKIYSTIPINAFIDLCDIEDKPDKFLSKPIYFDYAFPKGKELNELKKFDMVYLCREDTEVYRIAKIKNTEWITESVVDTGKYTFKLDNGKLIEDKIRSKEFIQSMKSKGICLIGRNSTHNPNVKINDVLERLFKME